MNSKHYDVVRDPSLDFVGQSYASTYPNLHRYPATMIPHLGIELLRRFKKVKGSLLDPYCGSGSSFASAIHVGFNELHGNDLNPLAILISSSKFSRIPVATLNREFDELVERVSKLRSRRIRPSELPPVTNIDFWFPTETLPFLVGIKNAINEISSKNIRNLALLAFSETVRDVSYTRNNEFKLYRIPADKMATHQPDTQKVFLSYLSKVRANYINFYRPLLNDTSISLKPQAFKGIKSPVDVVLTSPPYGDSGTTVAYGQFSRLTNEWLGIEGAKNVDNELMGGRRAKELLSTGVLASEIAQIAKVNNKRALEVSSFYDDLSSSIHDVSKAVKRGGLVFYIVGNRRVKDVQLSTDQFIAEEFERNGLKHEITYERLISSKSMPAVNSPSNKIGAVRGTMTQEFIVVCRK